MGYKMAIQYEDISATYIEIQFPRLSDKVKGLQNSWMGRDLSPYTLFYDCIFEDVVVSLKQNNIDRIQKYFDFVEELLYSSNENLPDNREGNAIENLIQTGFLEYFWDSFELYQLAQHCMRNQTKQLFNNIASYLRIPTDK